MKGLVVVAIDAPSGPAWPDGCTELARDDVGRGRIVVELETPPAGSTTEVIAQLRAAGLSAVEGPHSAGHRVAWANRNAPTFFGPSACVCFPWSRFDRDAVDVVVEIDPGTGFGSGGHPTTMLLLRRLRQLDLAGCRVLDVGCGTGVLAIASVLLGATLAVGVDVAPAAVVAARANAARNGVADRVEVLAADQDLASVVGPEGGFDLVVANIGLGVLAELAPDLRRLTKVGGLLAASGVSPAQPSMLAAELAPMGLAWTDAEADWAAVGFRWTADIGEKQTGAGRSG